MRAVNYQRTRRIEGQVGAGGQKSELPGHELPRACSVACLWAPASHLAAAPQNVYYRRTRRLDIPIITDIRILPEKETPSPFGPGWYKVSKPVSPRGPKLFLWYYKNQTLSDMSAAQRQNDLITEIDVTYGDDQPWYGFERLERPIAEGNEGKKLESVWLTVRKGVKRAYIFLPANTSVALTHRSTL